MSIQKEDALIVKDLYKSFKLPHEQNSGIKQAIVNMYRGKKGYEIQKVLRGISFEIKKGEFFGIVGRNGSGKSTLLKLLAGIYLPDKGEVHINGSLTPFIELGVGFNPELTGRENVFLNGALLGFDRKQMEQMYDDIVSFAELEKFMDQKLKNYSSGMQVRLAFSIAIRAESDILLIDEVLAVGDSAFQQKCYETFFELKRRGVTIILVTHDMGAVLKFCDRALLLSKGEITAIGKPFDISEDYLEQNYNSNQDAAKSDKKDDVDKTDAFVASASIHPIGSDKKTDTFTMDDEAVVEMEIDGLHGQSVNVGLQVFNSDGVYCFGSNTLVDKFTVPKQSSKLRLSVGLKLSLLPGNYSINLATMNDDATAVINYHSKIIKFRIKKTTTVEGVVNLEHTWNN